MITVLLCVIIWVSRVHCSSENIQYIKQTTEPDVPIHRSYRCSFFGCCVYLIHIMVADDCIEKCVEIIQEVNHLDGLTVG